MYSMGMCLLIALLLELLMSRLNQPHCNVGLQLRHVNLVFI